MTPNPTSNDTSEAFFNCRPFIAAPPSRPANGNAGEERVVTSGFSTHTLLTTVTLNQRYASAYKYFRVCIETRGTSRNDSISSRKPKRNPNDLGMPEHVWKRFNLASSSERGGVIGSNCPIKRFRTILRLHHSAYSFCPCKEEGT